MNREKDRMLCIFDIGNVVLGDIDMLSEISERFQLPYGLLKEDYDHYLYPMMDGVLEVELYIQHLSFLFDTPLPSDLFEVTFSPVVAEGVAELIRALRSEGIRVVAGSNTFAPHEHVIREMGVFSLFDRIYLSHHMGISKPFPGFFSSIIEQEGYGPQQVVFIDDLQENIEAASAAGLRGIRFHQAHDAVSELHRQILG